MSLKGGTHSHGFATNESKSNQARPRHIALMDCIKLDLKLIDSPKEFASRLASEVEKIA